MPVIGIMGESGSGKTTSMRNLDPKTTYYIDCDKKGLSWKGWKQSYNADNKNYFKTDYPEMALNIMQKIDKQVPGIKVIVVDTVNGLMVADEMRRSKEVGFNKWKELAECVYSLIDYALTARDDLTIIFVFHTQTEHTDDGYSFTHIKSSGRKLEKIVLESKLTTVLLAKVIDGRYVFETNSNNSTAKSPMGALEPVMDNDITQVLKALEDY